MTSARFLPLVLAWLLAVGCATERVIAEASGAEYRLRKVRIEGNSHLSDDEIEPYLHLQRTTWFPLPQRRFLHEGYVAVDADRIETLYDRRGYPDAEVLEVRIDRDEDRKLADVTFVVQEGEPTRVQAIRFRWPQGVPGGPVDRRASPARIEARCELAVGQPFDVGRLQQSEVTMELALASRGYAFAEVRGTATVDRVGRTAEVDFELVPGPWVRIGKVEIEGLQTVPEHPVRVEIEPHLGKPYSPRRIHGIEDSLYGMDVFSTVVATPAQAPRDGVVDLEVVVRESKPQRVKLGVGLGLQPHRWEEFVAMRYRHANLAHTLTRLEIALRAGYAELPAIYDPRSHGPIVELRPSVRKKGLLEDRLVWTLEPSFELGIQQGYQFYALGNRVGVARFFTRFVETGLSHSVRFVDFFAVSPALDVRDTRLGLDFRDPYTLSYIEAQLRLHFIDDIFTPRNGVMLGLVHRLAGGIFGGQFDYNELRPQLRAYYTPLPRRLQLASRLEAGFILPFGDEPGAPIDLRLYLGGADTMRGWGQRRLSPSIESCRGRDCELIPVGGDTMVLGNFETRARVWRDLWAVAFFDAGDVQSRVTRIRPSQWSYAVGPGLRYHSRIGTFRLDVGVRINDPQRFASEPRWAVHFGLGEAF